MSRPAVVIPLESYAQRRRAIPRGRLAPAGTAKVREVLRFGSCRLDRSLGLLTVEGEEVWLPPKSLAILDYLLEQPGAVVAREELVGAAWSGTAVTDHSLTEAIRVLRSGLGDDTRRPRYIQTIHKRGYRFIAEVVAE